MKNIKKLLAMVIAFAIIVTSCFVGTFLAQADTVSVWDGGAIKPTNGTGTEENPYLISTPEEFAYIIVNYKVGISYKLTNDIYLNDITKINWQDGTVVDGYTVNQWYSESNSRAFAGVLDGDGHTVYGMYLTGETAEVGFGLIPFVQEGGASPTTIKNLGLDYAYVNAPNGYAGAFVGRGRHNNTTTFDTCYIGANVTVNGADAGLFYGRGATGVAISNSYSLGTVTGTNYYGVVGHGWANPRTIDNSFFVNSPVTSDTLHSFTCTNVYATNITGAQSGATQLTTDNMKGLDALINSRKMSGLADCKAFTATKSYPVPTAFAQLVWEDVPDFSLDFEETYLDSSDNLYYDNTATNWSANNSRGSKAEAVTEANGNHAVRLTYDNENSNENYSANAVLNIYNPETKSKFVGTEGVGYTITFDYKVEQTDGKNLQLFVAPSNREYSYPLTYQYAFESTDMASGAVIYYRTTDFTEASGVITEATEVWIHTSVTYMASAPVNDHTVYPVILLQTNGNETDASTTENYASVLIDNIGIAPLVSYVEIDFEETYLTSSGNLYYGNAATNWSANNSRGSKAEAVTETNGNNAVRLTYDSENSNENYNANAVLNIYNPSTKSKFVGAVGVKYTISFDYKVERTDGKNLQLFIAPSNRTAYSGTDMGPKAVIQPAAGQQTTPFNAASGVITEVTEDWVHTCVTYTALAPVNDKTVYPIILLQTNGKAKDASTTENYASVLIDNIEVSLSGSSVEIDFEETYLDSSDNLYYNNTATNWSANNGRGSKAEAVTETNGNNAVRLTYDSENSNENYNANAVLNIYNPSTKSKFVGEVGVKYTISFDYKVERTDGKNLQLFIAPSNRTAYSGTDMGPKAVIQPAAGQQTTPFNAASGVITEVTEDWVHTCVTYTALAPVNDKTVYPIILLQTNGKAKDASTTENYASVLIDNIKVNRYRRALITCYDYDGSDNTFFIYEDTRFSALDFPSRKGYIFEGWHTDLNCTKKAFDNEFIGNYKAIYAKWFGNGELITPYGVTDSFDADVKKISVSLGGSTPHQISYVQNSMIDVAGSASVSNFYGSYVFSSESTVVDSGEKIIVDSINAASPASNTVMFYVELPNFEKAGAEWGLAFSDSGICIRQNSVSIWTDITSGTNNFDYCLNNEWVSSTITSAGVFTGLPSGYKGYIRIDLSALTYQSEVDFTSAYIFNRLELKFNALGGDNGNAVLGGLLYFPSTISDSTVVQIDGFYYELSKSSDAIVVNTYDVKSETGSSFSTRYTGTVGVAAVRYADDSETSAFWSDSPAVITTSSGNAETTTGYMTTYINNKAAILMQPGVDTMMFYVEMPVFNQSNTSAGLKFLDSTVEQGNKTKTLSFSNSIYWYADVNDASWKIARAGADGDLFDIPSGFKGFIKFDIKQFKNISDFKTVIDFSNMYYVTKFEFGFNHIGGENGNLVIGGAYSVINDSNAPFIKNGITLDKRCFKIITGDFDCDGTYDADDMILIKDIVLDDERELNGFEKLRENNIDIRTLVRAKKVFMGNAETDISVDYDNGAIYREIFTQDTPNNNAAIVYSPQAVTDWSRKIEADTSLNSEQKAIDFANEINSNTVGDFEKIGIDKMCHVSTFLYANGNIYVTYYANTISATENPKYQVARFAYAPENNTDAKVVLDIMQVGDDLYGHKVTGVYDTILMQKNDEPNNIYILWTASINGKYYRLYRIFNLTTQELGEIGVNRFKVGNVTNDFSSSGMMKALEVNSIGYKTFFSDIGIMQKLSTRVENGVTYYYTGAYSGNFTCIIKSKDLITWEYVAQPNEGANGTGFANATKWENAVYVLGDKVYYFVRQCDAADSDVYGSNYGILTCYNLNTNEWATPVLVGDCQSRSDFIYYQGNLYVFYAPTDRNHIGILKIDTDDIAQTEVVLQADMNGSCFYPFVQYNSQGELCMSYTVNRQHIRLASFTLSNYIN